MTARTVNCKLLVAFNEKSQFFIVETTWYITLLNYLFKVSFGKKKYAFILLVPIILLLSVQILV